MSREAQEMKREEQDHIMILGIGNLLFSDEGFGIHMVRALNERYDFAPNVTVMDGGVLGMSLLGYMSEADHLIVVDAVRNGGQPGALYRFEGDEIPARVRAKNSLHQVDFLEALTLCQALDKVPKAVILGVEPADIETLSVELTAATGEKIDEMIDMILKELDRLGGTYHPRSDR
ncbi:HyaD/HybD family hydrogenase maturation endopeptidase [Thermodesulfobacteriota bacterium]